VQSLTGEVTVLSFIHTQLLDGQIGNELAQDFAALAHHPRVLVDFSNIEALSSAPLGKLICLNRKIRSRGGQLKMYHLSDNVRKLMERLRLDRFFDIYETEAEALETFH